MSYYDFLKPCSPALSKRIDKNELTHNYDYELDLEVGKWLYQHKKELRAKYNNGEDTK